MGPPLTRRLRSNSTISVNISPKDQDALLALLSEHDEEDEDEGAEFLKDEEVVEERSSSKVVDDEIEITEEDTSDFTHFEDGDFDADARIKTLVYEPDDTPKGNGEDDDEYFESLKRRYLREESDDEEHPRRNLLNFDDVPYFPYQWMLEAKTEVRRTQPGMMYALR